MQYWFVYTHSFIHSIHSFNHSLIRLFIHSFIHSFISLSFFSRVEVDGLCYAFVFISGRMKESLFLLWANANFMFVLYYSNIIL